MVRKKAGQEGPPANGATLPAQAWDDLLPSTFVDPGPRSPPPEGWSLIDAARTLLGGPVWDDEDASFEAFHRAVSVDLLRYVLRERPDLTFMGLDPAKPTEPPYKVARALIDDDRMAPGTFILLDVLHSTFEIRGRWPAPSLRLMAVRVVLGLGQAQAGDVSKAPAQDAPQSVATKPQYPHKSSVGAKQHPKKDPVIAFWIAVAGKNDGLGSNRNAMLAVTYDWLQKHYAEDPIPSLETIEEWLEEVWNRQRELGPAAADAAEKLAAR